VAQHLAPDGILGVWSCRDHEGFFSVMQEAYPGAVKEHVRWDSLEKDRRPEPYHNVLFFGQKPG
jgi:hypothetical protein